LIERTGPAAIPPAARVLGFAGLLPNLVVLGAELWLHGRPGSQPIGHAAAMLAQFYAAVILSFLGGMWWGVAAGRVAPKRLWSWLAMAVAPSLVAAGSFVTAVWIAPPLGFGIVLGAGLLLSLFGDRRLVRAGLVPGWWMKLRVPLSVGLALETVAAALLG
jgi:hypothetical protein